MDAVQPWMSAMSVSERLELELEETTYHGTEEGGVDWAQI
jgi:hypothetical protein